MVTNQKAEAGWDKKMQITLSKRAITKIQTVIIIVVIIGALGAVVVYMNYTPTQKKEIRILSISEYSSEFSPFWDWLFEAFENETGIHVIYEPKAWDLFHEKMITSYLSGTSNYDVTYMWGNAWLLEVIDHLQPLDELEGFDRTEEPWVSVPWMLDIAEFEWNGQTHIWGAWPEIGWYINWYNTELFAEEGISEPPETTSELLEYAKRLTKDTDGDGAIDQYGYLMELGLTRAQYEFRSLIKRFGGDWLYANSTAGVNALNFMIDLLPYIDPVSWEIDVIGKNIAFQPGTIGMTRNSPTAWFPYNDPETSNVVGKVGMALQEYNTTNIVEGWGAGWSIPKSSEHKDWALEFLKFYSDPETQVKLTIETGWGSSFHDPRVIEEFPPGEIMAKYISGEAGAEIWMPYHQHMGEYEKVLDVQILAALRGEKTPKQALDDAMRQVLEEDIWEPWPGYAGTPPG